MIKAVRPLAAMARKLETYRPLQQDDLAALLALPHRVRTCAPASILAHEGERLPACMVLVSGFAFRQKCTRQGERQIVSIYLPGDALNFEQLVLNGASEHIQTLTGADVATIPFDALRELTGSRSAVADAIVASTLVEGSIAREWMLNIGRLDGRSRLAHFLCELAVRLGVEGQPQGQGYDLPMSQEQLADTLGLTAIHVNRMIRSLDADGLIKRKGRWITFPQWDTLCKVADFSDRYLHWEQHKVASRTAL